MNNMHTKRDVYLLFVSIIIGGGLYLFILR